MPDRGITAALRREVTERAGGCCEYCRSQVRYASQSYLIEHILARARGGSTVLDNLALACQGCNNYKYDKREAGDPVSGQTVPLYDPRRHRWDEHFAWSGDFLQIVGITPIGARQWRHSNSIAKAS